MSGFNEPIVMTSGEQIIIINNTNRSQAPIAEGEPALDDGNAENNQRTPEEEGADESSKYGAQHIVLVIVPVTVCMLIVCFTMLNLDFYKKTTDTAIQPTLLYTPIREGRTSSWGNLGVAILNSMIFVAIVLVMTIILVLLYKYRCYKIIHGWLIVSSFSLLFLFSFVYMINFGKWLNIAMDYFTTLLFLLNFGVLGMLAIHWKSPLIIQQFYLIIVGALMALLLIKYVPDWTSWVLLGALALYDLAAVLLPVGPLRVLVQLAQERDEPIFPALIYSSTMVTAVDGDDRIVNGDTAQRNQANTSSDTVQAGLGDASTQPALRSRRNMTSVKVDNANGDGPEPTEGDRPDMDITASSEEDEEEARGVKLGLGDFIFYSILIGKAAASEDYTVIMAVYIAIIFGLIATVVLLAFLHRALPALPISIFFGLTFYFGTMYIISPFVERLSYHQVFL